MKRLLIHISLLVFALFASLQVTYAQDFSRSVTPRRDSLEMLAFRARMDSIRQHRPTVALVLSGGGAKGAAHLGVFQYLDTLDIPVDLIVGTSMGGLMGSLRAIGYPTVFIDSLIRNIDWYSMMLDKIPREFISYKESKYKEKYLLSMPFYYPVRNEDDNQLPHKHRKFTIAASDEGSASFFKDNILGSLPSGYVYGQNVNNLINSLTLGYQDNVRFDSLKTPFVCVATDLASGKSKVWYDGKLNTALRTTMSMPAVFVPVRQDGMILVDGGMRDNYPTSLARDMGADIVIGVDVSAPSKEYSEIRYIADIVSQSMDLWGRDVYEKNVNIPDVNIRPDISGFSSLSFSKDNIDVLIANGYAAAKQQDSALVAIKNRLNGAHNEVQTDCSHSLSDRPVRISSIRISGVSESEKSMLRSKMSLNDDDLLSLEKISNIVADLYSTQCFEYVAYELHGEKEPYELELICRRGPIHHLGIGVRADTEEIASAVVNLGLWAHRLRGSRLDLNARFSANPYFQLHYSLNLPKVPTLNALFSVNWSQMKMFKERNHWNSLDYFSASADVFLSGLRWSFFDFKIGVKGDYFYDADSVPFLSRENYYPMKKNNYYLRPYLNVLADTFDDGYFPESGWKIKCGYEWVMTHNRTATKNLSYFHAIDADISLVVPAGKVFAWIPELKFRYLLGSSGMPIVYSNVLGGMVDARYMPQQMAFAGTTKVLPMKDFLTMLRSDFRFRFLEHHYITGIFNLAYSADKFTSLQGQFHYGAALCYSYNTIFGPISANVHWSSVTGKAGFYASIGYVF